MMCVGHDVVVSSLAGDPDRPLVTVRVNVAEHVKAYGAGPENKPQKRSASTAGNEIVKEGKGGSEQFAHQCD